MQVIFTKYPGLWFICQQCGAVVVDIKDNEIYNDSDVYCPCCRFKNTLSLNKNYDGIIKKQEIKEKNE